MSIKHYLTVLLVFGVGAYSVASAASWFDKLTEVVKENIAEVSTANAAGASPLTSAEISQAFKQALDIGSQKVVDQLGQKEGFNGDPTIRIPLPEKLQTVKEWLSKVGLGDRMNDLETRLNRAAENATPKARQLFVNTIQQMSFDDVKSIYNGGSDAATRYFQGKMTPELTKEMTPVVETSLSEVGAITLYDDVISDYKSIPFVPDIKADLVGHVVDGGLQGIFHYLAKEEAAIRENPVRRTTELLKRVFGQPSN